MPEKIFPEEVEVDVPQISAKQGIPETVLRKNVETKKDVQTKWQDRQSPPFFQRIWGDELPRKKPPLRPQENATCDLFSEGTVNTYDDTVRYQQFRSSVKSD